LIFLCEVRDVEMFRACLQVKVLFGFFFVFPSSEFPTPKLGVSKRILRGTLKVHLPSLFHNSEFGVASFICHSHQNVE